MAGESDSQRRGLVIVHTGEGKGKTTAALGLALRALGQGMRVLVIQFVKGPWRAGEHRMAERLGPDLEIIPTGTGFVSPEVREWPPEARQAVRDGWALARERVLAGAADLIVLDEVNYLLHWGALPVSEVLELLRNRPPGQHIVLTGRDAPPELIEAADLVTEMCALKHPHDQGVKAQRGIEY